MVVHFANSSRRDRTRLIGGLARCGIINYRMSRNIENKNSYERGNIVSCEVPAAILADLKIDNIDLPEGYCLIGGAARSVAFAMFYSGGGSRLPIRDIDIGYIEAQNPDLSQYERVSTQFMPDDYEHGHGAQEIGSVDDYMNSRDFTMNQVILQGNRLTITKRAIDDISRGIIRVAKYDEKWYPESDMDYKYVSDRLAIKAQLMDAVMYSNGIDAMVDPEMVNDGSYDYFSLALFLQKAIEYGRDVAEIFLNNLFDAGIFNADEIGGDITDVMKRINDDMLEWPFEWRNQAKLLLEEPDSQLDISDEAWCEEGELIFAAARSLKGLARQRFDREMAANY